MTTPIEKLFQIYTKKLAITKEQAEDATREYKTRVSQLPPKERKTFDYLVTFLDDVTKANHTNIFDVARSQYEKLQRSAPDYRSDYKEASRESVKRTEHLDGTDPTKGRQALNSSGSVNQHRELLDHPKQKQTIDTVYQSRNTSYQLKRSNPNIADLSDSNRPTKIAERYSELYDNEWTEAFEVLMHILSSERQAIDFLLRIITQAYRLGLKEAERQIQTLYDSFISILKTGVSHESDLKNLSQTTRSERPTEEQESLLRQIRKTRADTTIARLKKEFSQKYLRDITEDFGLKKSSIKEDGPVYKYASKCVEVVWWMCVQDPPIELCDPNSDLESHQSYHLKESVDPVKYRAYTKTGNTINYIVWPYLRLFKEGPILFKGVAQYK